MVYVGNRPEPWRIVGVVGDVREFGVDLSPEPQVFIGFRQGQRSLRRDLPARERAGAAVSHAGNARCAERRVVFDTPHDVRLRRAALIKEVLAWYDAYPGRVDPDASPASSPSARR